jgi:hypothetical protein
MTKSQEKTKPTYNELVFFIKRLVDNIVCDESDCATCKLLHTGLCKEADELYDRLYSRS